MMINPRTHEAYKLFHDGTLALARAERQGIRVDVDYLNRKMERLSYQIALLERKFMNTKFFLHWQHSKKGKVNIHSNFQLSHFLYNVKKLPPAKQTSTGQGATDEEALRLLNIPELDILLHIRKLKKVRDTYLEAFAREQVNGFIHPIFNLHLVKTFRSSSDSPNFQNIPKRDEESMQIVRKALYPRIGNQLLEVDYSGLEVRIAACYHKDNNMLKYINDPKSDMHKDIAQKIFFLNKFDKSKHNVLRQAAKNGFVFPQFYGDYYRNCAEYIAYNWCKLPHKKFWENGEGIEISNGEFISDQLIKNGITTYSDFEAHIESIEEEFWSVQFPEYYDWKERWYKMYQKYGYVDMLTGFRCYGPMEFNDCINYPIQGSAFHCLLWSFIQLDKLIAEENLKTRLIGQIHDSMLLDVVPSELEYIKKVVKDITCVRLPKFWEWIIVPLEVEMEVSDIDCSWADKK